MSYKIGVDTGDIADKAGQIQKHASDLETSIGALTSQMTQLADTWTGSAAASFQDLYHQWKGQAGQIQSQLASISTSLNSAGTGYATVEAQNAKQFSH